MIVAMSDVTRTELLATTGWLGEQLGRPGVRILDARWRPDGSGSAVHGSGRIPGSIHLDWRTDLVDEVDDGASLRLARPERIAALAERAGISSDSTVVVYDDTVSLYASRVWWSLWAYGFESVRVLDGGFPAWESEARPVTRTVVDGPLAPLTLPPTFAPHATVRGRVTTADVQALLGSAEVALIDARAPAEYLGFEGNTRRLGHIPGALNVPVGGMHASGSQRLRSSDELRSRLHDANVIRGRRMIVYDGSGVAAAKLALILVLLGHEDVAVYDGGWAEWGDRLDLPVDR